MTAIRYLCRIAREARGPGGAETGAGARRSNRASREPGREPGPFGKSLLLPFDGGGGLAGDVEDDAVDLWDLVGDASGDPGQDVVREPGPVRGHRVLAGHRAQHD